MTFVKDTMGQHLDKFCRAAGCRKAAGSLSHYIVHHSSCELLRELHERIIALEFEVGLRTKEEDTK